MPKRKMSDEQWIRALQECRSSGLTDKDWCSTQGMHPSTLYKAIRRLRKKACTIPDRDQRIIHLKQEVTLVASIDENGVIERPPKVNAIPVPCQGRPTIPCGSSSGSSGFETAAQIILPSGINIELSNNTNAATIRNILGVLQCV